MDETGQKYGIFI